MLVENVPSSSGTFQAYRHFLHGSIWDMLVSVAAGPASALLPRATIHLILNLNNLREGTLGCP